MVSCYGVCDGLMDFCLGCSNFEFLLTETFLAHRLCLLFAVQEKKAHIFMRSPFYIHCSLLNHIGSNFNIPLRPTEINISFWSPFRSISLNISQYHSISALKNKSLIVLSLVHLSARALFGDCFNLRLSTV